MALTEPAHPNFLVIGPHGSGIHQALQAFRQYGFITLSGVSPDNLPTHFQSHQTEAKPIAIAPELVSHQMDAANIHSMIEDTKKQVPHLNVLYLSASTEILIQRFSEAEKKHPYETSSLQDAIESEQLLYQTLKPLSDYHINTSATTIEELRLKIAKILKLDTKASTLTINLVSFGFKHGVPTDADMIFDTRILPNPFYDISLRPLTGLDGPVKDYVLKSPEVKSFQEHWHTFLTQSLPLYQQQGRTRVTIGIGCTGGQHRSVAMTMALLEHLQQALPHYQVRAIHREQNHWPTPAQTAQPS